MKKLFKILVLTDHRAHSIHNSVYTLANALRSHPKCEHIHIASRGYPGNEEFFYRMRGTSLKVNDMERAIRFSKTGKAFQFSERMVDIRDYDFILMRLPRPIPTGFFDFLLEQVPEERFINSPRGIAITGHKRYLLNFEGWAPPMRFCTSLEHIYTFKEQFPIVLKPVESYGGNGILRLENDQIYVGQQPFLIDTFIPVIEQQLLNGGYLAMKYLKNVHMGDKRIIVINGEIMGAALRLPAKDSWLCNASQGGTSHYTEPDDRERQMVQAIHEKVSKEGIVMFGLDTLVDDHGNRVLSEINTLSIGGLKQLNLLTGKPVVKKAAKALMEYIGGL